MSCGLYLLLTTQRSGSTWACQLLNSQPGINCGLQGVPLGDGNSGTISETMIQYSFMRRKDPALRNVTLDSYTVSLERALTKAAESSRCGLDGAGGAAGFKLMYDQIPDHLVAVPKGRQEAAPLMKWLAERRVSVVHLVREATILRFASQSQTEWAGVPNFHGHTNNESLAAAMAARAKPMHWEPHTLPARVRAVEATDRAWQLLLMFSSGLRYLYLP
jgi:LPS sulfotransferase NodH